MAGGHGTTVRGKNPKQKWLLQNKNTKIHTFKIFIVVVYHAITQTQNPSLLMHNRNKPSVQINCGVE